MQVKILSVAQLTKTAYDIRVLAPGLDAKPGQFVHILCDGLTLRRPISVCDYGGEVLRLVVDTRGKGTEWLVSRKVGDELDMLAPLGNGFEVQGKRILVVGGGIGIPPLFYAARTATLADAILGFRNRDAVMMLGDFKQVAGITQVCTDDGSFGAHGRVDALLSISLKNTKVRYDMVAACGPKPMLKAVAGICAENNMRVQVSLEERMACGLGACLGCAAKVKLGESSHYFHVCSYGPVFEGNEVVFDD